MAIRVHMCVDLDLKWGMGVILEDLDWKWKWKWDWGRAEWISVSRLEETIEKYHCAGV